MATVTRQNVNKKEWKQIFADEKPTKQNHQNQIMYYQKRSKHL